jgi:DNA modification methylase
MSVSILIGDILDRLAEMPDNHFDTIVTSPPYWGLRDYGVEGQIGLEPTLADHIAKMVEVFRELRRVLKPTGTCWMNYGDCYASAPNGRSAADSKATGLDDRAFRDKPMSTVGGLIKAKDLCMIPNRLAIALCDDGWYVRAECIWGKSNSMPDSSGSQRPAIAHEKVFMFTKSADADIWRARDTGELSFAPDLSERCPLVTDPDRTGARWTRIGAYYDANEVLQGRASDEDANGYRGGSYVGGSPGPRTTTGNKRVKMPDGWDTGAGGHGSFHREGREKGKTKEIRGRSTHGRHTLGNAIPSAERRAPNIDPAHAEGKNHTGLMALGRGEGRYLRNFEPAPLTVWEIAIEPFKGAHFATFPTELARRCLQAGCPKGGKVLDPFGGAGTTALVADRMGLDCTLIELSPEYAEIARKRINGDMGLFGTVEVAA